MRELGAKFRRWQEELALPAIAARRRNEVGESAALVASAGRQLSHDINELASGITRGQGAAVRQLILESGRVRGSATHWAIGMVGATMGLAVAAGVYFSMQLRRRLSDLEDAAEALARGDFEQRAPTASRDEIGRLARSFNAMAEQVQARTLEAAGLRKLSELLQACGNVKEAFEVTEMVVPSLLPEARGVIHVVNASRSLLEVVTHFGLSCDADLEDSSQPAAPDVTPIFLIWQKLSFVLGGLMLPIGIYPDWLRVVAEHTPFAALLYGPGQLVVQGGADDVLRLSVTLVAWGALFLMVVVLLERRARRSVCLHGG